MEFETEINKYENKPTYDPEPEILIPLSLGEQIDSMNYYKGLLEPISRVLYNYERMLGPTPEGRSIR